MGRRDEELHIKRSPFKKKKKSTWSDQYPVSIIEIKKPESPPAPAVSKDVTEIGPASTGSDLVSYGVAPTGSERPPTMASTMASALSAVTV